MKRYAEIHCGLTTDDPVRAVQNYLPSNYKATHAINGQVFIEGEDRAGWTLDGYVLPRLASGWFHGQELPAPSTNTGETP